jgi:hypothetical protein
MKHKCGDIAIIGAIFSCRIDLITALHASGAEIRSGRKLCQALGKAPVMAVHPYFSISSAPIPGVDRSLLTVWESLYIILFTINTIRSWKCFWLLAQMYVVHLKLI